MYANDLKRPVVDLAESFYAYAAVRRRRSYEQHNKKEVLGRTIEAWLTWRGKDLLVTVTGGDAAHIGSVSVCRMCGGEPRLEKYCCQHIATMSLATNSRRRWRKG